MHVADYVCLNFYLNPSNVVCCAVMEHDFVRSVSQILKQREVMKVSAIECIYCYYLMTRHGVWIDNWIY
jgi:hypothetical protein